MESNLVCNHMSDWENQMTGKLESHLSITSLRKKLDIGYTFSWKDNGSVAEMRGTTAHAYNTHYSLTQAWHVNCSIQVSSYKHCPIGLVITNHMQEFF